MAKKHKQKTQQLNGDLFRDLDYNLIIQFYSYKPFIRINSELWGSINEVYHNKMVIYKNLVIAPSYGQE